MRGGKLRNRFEIVEDTKTTDAWGHDVAGLATIGFLFGSLEMLTGRELIEAKQIRTDVSHKIVTRYDRRLTAKHSLQLGNDAGNVGVATTANRVFEIASINNVGERNEKLEIMAIERPA